MGTGTGGSCYGQYLSPYIRSVFFVLTRNIDCSSCVVPEEVEEGFAL